MVTNLIAEIYMGMWSHQHKDVFNNYLPISKIIRREEPLNLTIIQISCTMRDFANL